MSKVFAGGATLSACIVICSLSLELTATAAFADPQDNMGRWAPDDRWKTWQDDIDKGYAAYQRHDFTLAEKLYLKALEKAKRFADNPSRIVETLAKLDVSLVDSNSLEKAEPYYKEVLNLACDLNKRRSLDEMAAICMEDLANTYEEASAVRKRGVQDYTKRRVMAKSVLNHAIEIRTKVFSPYHPKLMITRSSLADVYIVDHEWDNARIQLEFIRDAQKRLTGTSWLHYSRCLTYLGCVYEKLGRKSEATAVFTELKKRFALAKNTADLEKNRGSFYRLCGETNNAESWFKKELAVAIKQSDQLEEVAAYRNLGNCCDDRNNPAEAEKYYRRALELAKKTMKRDRSYKFTDMTNEVERTLRAQKKFHEADVFHMKEADFLRVKNPLFKSPTQLYQEEIDVLKDIDAASKVK